MASPDNLPLRDLQKIILGKRTEPLSVVEIRNLFSYPTTPESILYIITALNQECIDPNTTLVQAIANATKKEDLISISLALRYNADCNLYVSAPNIGDIHILGYVYLVLSKRSVPLLNAVVIMLMVMGSDYNRLIFDSEGGAVKDEYSLVEPVKGQTVLDWLEDQGYNTIIPQIKGQNYSDVEPSFMTTIATFLDKDNLLVVTPDPEEIIGSHSVDILANKNNDIEPSLGLKLARKYLNLTAYELFTDLGGNVSYAEVNDMILSIKYYKNIGDFISMSQAREMLLYSISRGVLLDKDQIELIGQISERLLCKIGYVYFQPYWIKACSISNGKASDKLKLLAYQLNLDPEVPKDTLCHRIKSIAKADPDMVKQFTITRQKMRIRSDVSFINQFDNYALPSDIKCNNRSLIKANLYDLPDKDIGYYRDNTNALWCFTSNNFAKMVEKKINPYTNEEFPSWFVSEIEDKIAFITTYRDIDKDPKPISYAVDLLRTPDIPDNQISDRYVELFEELMQQNDIAEWNIEKLSESDMSEILSDVFAVDTDLSDLTRPHAVKTFYITSLDQLEKHPDKSNSLFQKIKDQSTDKNEK